MSHKEVVHFCPTCGSRAAKDHHPGCPEYAKYWWALGYVASKRNEPCNSPNTHFILGHKIAREENEN